MNAYEPQRGSDVFTPSSLLSHDLLDLALKGTTVIPVPKTPHVGIP